MNVSVCASKAPVRFPTTVNQPPRMEALRQFTLFPFAWEIDALNTPKRPRASRTRKRSNGTTTVEMG